MKEHYAAVLQDMDEKERKLEAQLTKIRAARPAILALMEDATHELIQASPSLASSQKYATMGPREAVLDLLSALDHPMDSNWIERKLKIGGVKSNSPDFPSIVKSTLANLKKLGKIERVENGWMLTRHPRVVDHPPVPWVAPTEQQHPLPQ